ncbi:stage III sporulation protein AA [Paenibacillus ferrarius]|uniref:stage III sporulation protein AA n=1 Tax=Paenibacillus ferrarius TaxID=1469647 RepID=UPI003D28527A
MLASVLYLLPHSLRSLLSELPGNVQASIEEIRVRESRPLEISWEDRYAFVSPTGRLVNDDSAAYRPTRQDCMALLEMLTNHSLYTFEEELRRGYITVTGGHRVGLAGRTILENGHVKQIRDVGSFNLRIAKEIHGVGRDILPGLVDPVIGSLHHTLIISPPQQGKTTLIRDLARLISRGEWGSRYAHLTGKKVGIIDERSELAASHKGVPRFDLGPRTDVMDGCPKAEGMMMMIRSLSPEVLVVDEIGRAEDAVAIHEAVHSGIRVLATAHGASYEDIRRRPVLRELIADGVFMKHVILSRRKGAQASFRILDHTGKPFEWQPERGR